ncbi:MAG: NAD-dependent dehydratase [Desulfatitalea sp. BRH_c12]|nr:MAG: NAD-dependent dehydratase [Desulfatitalea sp. BRH_c12]
MKVLILGGDGYLGWPTAMHLSAAGHEVGLADNYLRRNLCREEDVEPLFAVPNLNERVKRWGRVSGCGLAVFIGDLIHWEFISHVFETFRPEAVIHYAEQPSAPHSMLNRRAAMLTLTNNLTVTANVIFAIKQFSPDSHLIKLGTMGEYGTPDIDIEEGWLDVAHKGRRQTFLYPRQASSLYHTTKIMDTDLLWFYVRTWKLRVTDLMQGPVYGLVTETNRGYPELYPFFNYDELFGTVINRFIVQAAGGYPLTVYGKGGQTRGYLDLRDTLQCIELSLNHPASSGELRIFNQFVELFAVNGLAERIRTVGKSIGLKVDIRSVANPRIEQEEHYYRPASTALLELGLQPHYLSDAVLVEMMEIILRHKDAIDAHKIFRGVKW